MSMKFFRITTMTMCCEITYSLDVESLSKIVPLKIIRDEDGNQLKIDTTEKKDKIGFYGANNVIISCGYENKYKGVRRGKKQLHKVIGIDLQIGNKNINMKISSKNFQLTGASSKDNGIAAFEKICSLANRLQSKINYFRKFSERKLSTLRNIILFNYTFKETGDLDSCFEKYIVPICNKKELEKSITEKEKLKIIENYNTRYSDVIDYFEIYTSSPEEDVHSIGEILRVFFSGTRIVEGERSLGCKGVRIINLLAMNKIECSRKIPILHVISALANKFPMMNRGVEEAGRFHIKSPFVPSNGTEKNKTLFHKFNFFATGTIRQHSPSDEKEAYQVQSEIMEIVREVLNEWKIEIY